MGAIPYSDSSGSGVTFRVWAPFAQSVAVAGDFNAWSPTAIPLDSEGNGNWSVDVSYSAVGSQYKYVLAAQGTGAQFWRVDPYARSITRAANGQLNCVIATSRETYSTPAYPPDDIPDGWTLMQTINSLIQQRQPWKISIAEDMKDNEWITRSTSEQGAGFSAQWGASFVSTVRAALIALNDSDRDMDAVAGVIGQMYNANAFQRVIYTESHDADSNGAQRVPEMIWPGNDQSWFSKKRATLGAAVVMTAPGIPMISMGQEFLCGGWFNPDAALDWTNSTTLPGIITLHRDLIRLRRNWSNNTRGLTGQGLHVHHVDQSNNVIAFHRWAQGGTGDDVVIVLNFSTQAFDRYAIGFPRSGAWRVRFNSDSMFYDPAFGNTAGDDASADQGSYDGMPFSGNVGFGPYSAVIFSQD
jgi:1,4-alpha-glucan branching enzyme